MFPRLVPHPAEPLDQVCLALQAQIEDSWVLLSWKILCGNEEFKNLSYMAKKRMKEGTEIPRKGMFGPWCTDLIQQFMVCFKIWWDPMKFIEVYCLQVSMILIAL